MALQLTDNIWQPKLDASLDANTEQHSLGAFSNPYVVIQVSSDNVNSSWQQAGSIGQAIPFENNFAYGEVKPLTLDTYLLLQFPLLTGDSYQLYYFPLARLVEAKVKVWEYQGNVVDISLNKLVTKLETTNLFDTQLTEITNKLCDLTKLVESSQCKASLSNCSTPSCEDTRLETLLLLGYL